MATLPSDEAIQAEIDKIWAAYDDNKNGKLDKDEASKFVKDVSGSLAQEGMSNEEAFNHVFKELDTDGTGTIDVKEMLNFFKKILGFKPEEKPAEGAEAAEKPADAPAEGEKPAEGDKPAEGEDKDLMSPKKKQSDGDEEVSPEKVPEEAAVEDELPEEVSIQMGIDEFYEEDHDEKPIEDSSLSRRNMNFFGCFGQSSFKRYNFHSLGDDSFIFATGNQYQILNVSTMERRIFHSKDTDGVGSIAVHPNKKYFAVGEKGINPNIYIYEYPSLKLYRVCRKGTEKRYAHIEFSTTGEKLASLGGSPDFNLTVWDWLGQKVVLRAKAFSQEVFRVSFSPFTDDILFTCGQGHIRFWKMAQTFTGLKLQGEIAKFGQLELSDVSSFYELPDGKVISGTEYGTIIVWEGQFVKAHLMLDDEEKTPLHDGAIEVIIQDGEFFISAGADGYIKWWRVSEVDSAEADEGVDVALKPSREIQITSKNGKAAHIMNMILADEKWYIQDGKGKIWVMDHGQDNFKEIYSFQQGKINDLVCSQSQNYAVTIGENGMVKVWDYIRKVSTYEEQFSGAGTCLVHMPHSDINKGRCFAAGFDNGIVRILSVNAEGIVILKSFKAHDDPIIGLKYSADLKLFVTASNKGAIFFFDIDGNLDVQRYDPLCTIDLPEGAHINDFKWSPGEQSLMFACSNGFVYEVDRPDPQKIDNGDSYYWDDAPIKEWKIKIMEMQMAKNQKKDEAEEEKRRRMRLRGELPPEDEEEEEVWDPDCIRAIIPFTNDEGKVQFLYASQGKFNGFIYIGQMGENRPLKSIEIPADILVTYMNMTETKDGNIITLGFENGEVQKIINMNFEKRMVIKQHDGHTGQITSCVFNRDINFILTVGHDGLLIINQFDRLTAQEENVFKPLAKVEGANYLPEEERQAMSIKKFKEFCDANPPVFDDIDEGKMAMDEAALAISIKTKDETGIDVEDANMYSIQQAKLRTEEDARLSLADKKKQRVRNQIQQLRVRFTEQSKRNEEASNHIRLLEDDFQIDPEFFSVLYDRNEAKIEETKKEVAWGIEFHTLSLNKVKNKFYDVLEFEKFTVKGIQNGTYVTTFRVQKMSEFLQKNIESFKQMLENEIIGKEAEVDEDFMDDASNKEEKVDNEKQKDKEKAAMLAAKQKAAQQAAVNAKKTDAEKKREERKLQREERKRKIEKLEKKEAMHSGEDPEDRKEIDIAQATYGDYKLKLSSDYTVPENQRVNFSKKRQQMVLLEGSIHKLKVDFNQKIQELKVRKKDIVDHVIMLNTRLSGINSELIIEEELFVPQIDKNVEYPENFFEIKDEDIEKKKAQKLAAAGKAKGARKVDGEDPEDEGEELEKAQKVDVKGHKSVVRKNAQVQDTKIDQEYLQIRKIELTYEKDQKKKEIDNIIKSFDEEVKEMQKEKYRLESDLKNAEMKLLLFFEELILLKSMESKDHQLTKRLASCRQEKGQILKEINEISRKLKDKKKEIDEIKEKEEDLMNRFHELCPERSDKYEEIRKFFEKIIKRRRRIEKPQKADDDEDEEDEDGGEEEEFEEDEDEDEDENTIAGLPPEEYKIEDIEKLREERLDLYEDKEKILCFINDLEVQRKKLENKEKAIKTELEETEEEIQDFQSEKMSKLNQLQVSVVLKMKQIQNLEQDIPSVEKWAEIKEEEINRKLEILQNKANMEGNDDPMFLEQQKEMLINEQDWRGFYMPKDLKKTTLFTRTQLLQLINRKRELDEEFVNLNKAFREYKRDFNQKKREIKENEKIRELREREYNEKQMLRFGNLVDLDNLEISGPSPVVLDLQNKFTKTEKRCIKMIEDADGELENTQRNLTGEMKNNTNLLNLIRQLGEEELDLDKKLNDSNKAIFVDEDDEKKRHIMEEKLKIKKLLEIQAKEIETFKTEINMYKRKGGHIYTKVTTNRRVANLNQDN